MMENATENFLLRVSRRTAHRRERGEPSLRRIGAESRARLWRPHLCRDGGCICRSLDPSGQRGDEEETPR